MTDKPILYLGDLSLATAAGYLTGLMTMWDVGYDYLPTDVTVNGEAQQPRNLFVISDYPAKRMPVDVQETIIRRVEAGAGLIMIGGWESFHGFGGDWDNTPLAAILPVEIHAPRGALARPPHALFWSTTRTGSRIRLLVNDRAGVHGPLPHVFFA